MSFLRKLAVIDMGDFDYSPYINKHGEMMHLILNGVKKRDNMIFVFSYQEDSSKPKRVEVGLMVDHSIYKILEELFNQKIDENDELISLTIENMERKEFYDILYQRFEMEINSYKIET